jgi:enoyl-CoA hydratase/carnithine racemase
MQNRADDIIVAVDPRGIATVTIDRPAKRNALSLAMWRRLATTFEDLGADGNARVVVLTGNGGHFSAGADISEFAQVRNSVESGRVYEHAVEAALLAMRDCAKPTIAAVTGFGLGGGCGVALACDLRTGDATTRMGIPAAKLGNVYGLLECDLLLRQVGLANAKLVLYSGRQFAIDECRTMGLVDAAGATALEAAYTLAVEMADNAPISLEGAKIVLEALEAKQTQERHEAIETVLAKALASEDYREAARAFVEKRKPVFHGR